MLYFCLSKLPLQLSNMTWKQFFTSSIGKKFIVGFTGLFLILFLVIHASVNASIFLNDQGDTFNTIAHFMSHNWIIRILEVGLFVGLFAHAIQGLMVWQQNKKSRPVAYLVSKANKNSKWYSRSMGILGSLLLLFLVMHISHFFVGTKVDLYSTPAGVESNHNLYYEMKLVFAQWYWVVLYMVGLIALFWHLLHGTQSALQTFGINHKKYTPLIKCLGAGYAVLITILFALMPLAFYFGWIN